MKCLYISEKDFHGIYTGRKNYVVLDLSKNNADKFQNETMKIIPIENEGSSVSKKLIAVVTDLEEVRGNLIISVIPVRCEVSLSEERVLVTKIEQKRVLEILVEQR